MNRSPWKEPEVVYNTATYKNVHDGTKKTRVGEQISKSRLEPERSRIIKGANHCTVTLRVMKTMIQSHSVSETI
jgi:hypothetical protein